MTRTDASPRRARRTTAAAAALAAALALPAALAQSPIERGRALYETRCGACHDRSVHQRAARKATDFAALRREVERWSTNSGGEWRTEELDAVTVFLNERYYRHPCPATVCPEPFRAQGPRRGG